MAITHITDRKIVSELSYYSYKNIVLKVPEYNDRTCITTAKDTLTTDRTNIASSYYFKTSDKYIVHNFYPQTIKEYRYVYQKSPHEFITKRYFTFGLHIPPNDIKKVVTVVAPKAITDKYIVHGTPYIPYNNRLVFAKTTRQPALRVLKYPDYYSWNNLPNYIDKITFYVKKDKLPIDWGSLNVIININQGQKIISKNIEHAKYTKLDNYDDIYKVEIDIKERLPENSQVELKLYLVDTQGNYLSNILW